MIQKLTIIIPVFNEGKTIYQLLKKVVDINLVNDIEKEIIAVDDCSLDNSKDEINRFLAEHKNLIFLENEINLGKGGSIRTAIAEASGDYTVIQDADLELNPNEINDLLIPVLNNEADIAIHSLKFAFLLRSVIVVVQAKHCEKTTK